MIFINLSNWLIFAVLCLVVQAFDQRMYVRLLKYDWKKVKKANRIVLFLGIIGSKSGRIMVLSKPGYKIIEIIFLGCDILPETYCILSFGFQ